jgi:F-type H+-transporting ATPase subunit delta
MNDNTMVAEVAAPYAKALMSIAQDNNSAEQVGQEVAGLLGALESSDELNQFLGNPLIAPEAKKGVLKQITEGNVNQFVLNFLMLLVDRNRVMYLESILRQYQALLRELNQTILADVTTATELSDEQKEAIKSRVISMTGASNVELSVEIDPSLIGGLIIQVGSQVIDASLRGQLRRIGMQLSTAA